MGFIMASEIETPEYQLLEKKGQFEIRVYEPMIIAITNINSNYSPNWRCFRILLC